MANHPNRGASPARNPAPEEIRAAREGLGLSQRAAAEIVFSSTRAWEDWEGGRRKLHPSIWRDFRRETGLA